MEVYGHPAVGMACEENTLGFVVLTTTGQFYDGCFWEQGRVTQGDSRLAETGRPIKTHQLKPIVPYRIEAARAIFSHDWQTPKVCYDKTKHSKKQKS